MCHAETQSPKSLKRVCRFIFLSVSASLRESILVVAGGYSVGSVAERIWIPVPDQVEGRPFAGMTSSKSASISCKSGASVKLSLSRDLKGGHHGMTRLPCSPTGMPAGNRAV